MRLRALCTSTLLLSYTPAQIPVDSGSSENSFQSRAVLYYTGMGEGRELDLNEKPSKKAMLGLTLTRWPSQVAPGPETH